MEVAVRIRAGISFLQQALFEPSTSIEEQAMVLWLLASVAPANKLAQRLHQTLAKQATTQWIKQADFTTVFMTLCALQTYTGTAMKGDQLASAAHRLLTAEQEVGGPYYSPPLHVSRAAKLDPFANAWVTLFATQAAGTLPKVRHFLTTYQQRSTHYQSDFAPHIVKLVVAAALSQPWRSSVTIANQHTNGNWPMRPFRIWPAVCMSEVVPTALALHVLAARYHLALKPAGHTKSGNDRIEVSNIRAQHTAEHIYKLTQQRCQATLPPHLRSVAKQVLRHIQRADKTYEISMLTHFFVDGLREQPTTIDEHLCDLLGEANIACWAAYTIFDDIIDEAANTQLLPIANVMHRLTVELLKDGATPAMRAYITHVFNHMDAANAWELQHAQTTVNKRTIAIAQIPSYRARQIIAERAFAHVLGPLVILDNHGIRLKSATWRHCEAALRHYIIARQLNDDLHDWQSDLRQGKLSFVVSHLLGLADIRPGKHALATLEVQLHTVFKAKGLAGLVAIIAKHTRAARRHFAQAGLLQPDHQLLTILQGIEQTARISLNRAQDQQTFLRTYGSSAP